MGVKEEVEMEVKWTIHILSTNKQFNNIFNL